MTRFHYRCRMCGEQGPDVAGFGFPTPESVKLLMNACWRTGGGGAPSMRSIHQCSPLQFGISDLIGAVTEPEENS